MAIGDDLQILLGLVPIRDRAGIARGTMADAAAAAADRPHANGQELTRQGFDFARPPALSLPPGMTPGASPPPPGDVQLPDDVNAEYAAGSGGNRMSPVRLDPKTPLPAERPVPSERVIASSPAAAPSPTVMRNSDVLLKAYEQQLRAQRMQAIFQAIGGMVSSMQGQPVHGGGGGVVGPDLATLKTLQDMRTAEDQATEQLAQKARAIDDFMLTHPHTSREHATTLFEQGQMGGRNSREGLAAEEKIRETDRIRQSLEPHISAYAKALGMDEAALRAELQRDPEKVIELVKPGSIEKIIKERYENQKTGREAAAFEASVTGKDPTKMDAWDLSPAAKQKYFEEQAQEAVRGGTHAAEKRYDEFITKKQPVAEASENYLKTTAQEAGRLWDPSLITGTGAAARQAAWRAAATMLEKAGYGTVESLQKTADIQSALAKMTIANTKLIPGPASNKDTALAASVSGSREMTPMELRSVMAMNERIHRQVVEAHRAEQAAAIGPDSTPEVRRRFEQARRIDMPEPSKILQDDLNAPSPANDQLRTAVRTAYNQYQAAKGTANENEAGQVLTRTAKHFDEQFFPGAAQYFIKQKGGK